jgi:uncharacterized SAM-binding protein YcdF (DUF218 family)
MKLYLRRGIILFVALVAATIIAAPHVLRAFGSWLAINDFLMEADAIVVLGGDLPFRAMEAGEIYKKGLAPEVWVTRPAASPEVLALEKLQIGFIPEYSYSVRVLLQVGVASSAIRVVAGDIVNTEDEVRAVIRALDETGKHRVILVTSEFHCRRVRIIWNSLAPLQLKATIRFPQQDPFDRDHWWRNSRDVLAVSREMGGILNAWAGFPLSASRQ